MHTHELRLVDHVLRHPRQDLFERDAAFEAREWRAEAHVDAVAEREVRLLRAADVELVRARDRALVRRDLAEGTISPAVARDAYGLTDQA